MTDLDEFNTVHYASWHFPCYRKLNCPKRYFQNSPQGTSDTVEVKSESPDNPDSTAGPILGMEFGSLEAGATFALLSVFVLITFAGAVFISGALLANKGYGRPYNQVRIFRLN